MRRCPTKVYYLLTTLFFISCALPEALAQTQTRGAISGRVVEYTTKAPIPGASVKVTNEQTGLTRSGLTDTNGEYFFDLLPPSPVYMIVGTAEGYEPVDTSWAPVTVRIMEPTIVRPPPIELRKIPVTTGTTTGVPTQPPKQAPVTTPPGGTPPLGGQAGSAGSEAEQLVNTVNASRTQNFDTRQLLALPLAGIRTFDDLAFLAAGVAPPPLAIGGIVGPGIGPGVGTSGQYAVNGIRSRANNYTVDGSDNNDEDIGVRRQGFTSLIPQSIESMEAVQITTLLPVPQLGRNMGAQINGVSRSGGIGYHGTLYGFYTDRRLKARDAFDLTGGDATFPLAFEGKPVILTRQVNNNLELLGQLAPANPVDGENSYTRGQYGFVFGGPIVKNWTNFFFSFEHQDINAARESNFAVPSVDQRGLFSRGGTCLENGVKGICRTNQFGNEMYPSSVRGNAFLSLYPFPNNPGGPYGNSTYTEILPASADGNIFSIKLDQKITAFNQEHTLTGRYNFTDDDTTLPVTGEALFSTLRALVRTQNLSLFFDSPIPSRAANQLRISYGRTSLRFEEVRSQFLLPAGDFLTDSRERSFLLNAPYVFNRSRSSGPEFRYISGVDSEDFTGPLGQVLVTGYSPIGVDVFNFPQQRTNNTYQLADTFSYSFPKHRLTTGFDTRWTHLNSFLDRNFRPQAVFNGACDLGNGKAICPLGIYNNANSVPNLNPVPFYFGRDYLAVGAPTGFFQTFSKGFPDSTIGLKYWQHNLFFSDQIRVRPNFMLTLGLRYELNTVPREQYRRIESTFNSPEVQQYIALEKQVTGSLSGFGGGVSGFETFLSDRTKIYRTDANNIAPHIAFAWDPTNNGKTSIRAGYGIYYDQILGSVISQSRNVFPSFLTFNFGGFSTNCLNVEDCIDDPDRVLLPQVLRPQNPSFFFAKPGTLNQYQSITGDPVLDMLASSFFTNLTTGPGFILPNAHLDTPYAQHWALTVEREIGRDFLFSTAYVGTKGTHLLRFATPNLGPNAIAWVREVVEDDPPLSDFPAFKGITIPPSGSSPTGLRPFPLTGSFASIESDANSNYHSLQVQLNKRFSKGIQFTTAYTWSHAIDEVSDLFDLAGAPALPQNSFSRSDERGDANFDVRHRFVYSFIWNLPGYSQKGLLGGWQLASIGAFQTAQPYSILFCCDINLDGNATDRVTFLGSADLGDAGRAPRNTRRAQSTAVVHLAVNKQFNFSERSKLEIRSEFFNLFNRTHFGIPVNRLFFGNLTGEPLTQKTYVDTRLPARTIQFGLRYSF